MNQKSSVTMCGRDILFKSFVILKFKGDFSVLISQYETKEKTKIEKEQKRPFAKKIMMTNDENLL